MNLAKGIPVAALGVLAASGGLIANVGPLHSQAQQRMSSLEAQETHASASLLGQFRTSMSAWLWVRTDLYLHNGVELRPMTRGEHLDGTVEAKPAEGEMDFDEHNLVTVIPSKDRDFRGLFGDLDREVNAYKDMHEHTHNDPRAALPLYRLTTWVDPTFTPAWVVGASVIAQAGDPDSVQKAVAFLSQGLEENPSSIAIPTEIARLQLQLGAKQYPVAVRYLEQARRSALAAQTLSEDDTEALRDTYRWLAMTYRELGDIQTMRDRASEGLQAYADDAVLHRLGAKPPLMLAPDKFQDYYRGKL